MDFLASHFFMPRLTATLAVAAALAATAAAASSRGRYDPCSEPGLATKVCVRGVEREGCF